MCTSIQITSLRSDPQTENPTASRGVMPVCGWSCVGVTVQSFKKHFGVKSLLTSQMGQTHQQEMQHQQRSLIIS